jgi:pilus assembly protein Flp/PilA
MNVTAQLFRDDSGATMVEYAIMLALIAAVCITLVAALGGTTRSEFSNLNSTFKEAQGG